MDILRITLTAAILALAATAEATPVDAVMDLMDSIDRNDGEMFLASLSDGLKQQIESAIEGIRTLAQQQPELALEMLLRIDTDLKLSDLEWYSNTQLVSIMLERVQLPSGDMISGENLSMSGRNAQVTISWYSGYSADFQLVWEQSSWKVNGSSILETVLRR